MKYLYGVFIPGGTWYLETSRRRTLTIGRRWGVEVRRMPWPESNLWDAPTFRMCSDLISQG